MGGGHDAGPRWWGTEMGERGRDRSGWGNVAGQLLGPVPQTWSVWWWREGAGRRGVGGRRKVGGKV